MIAINYEDCNGCGECAEICPTGAIILQNGKAALDESLCEGCLVCVDSCPQGAIVIREPIPVGGGVIRITEPAPSMLVPEGPRGVSIREAALPVIGSILLWTGREIVPRLANLALDYLDRRIQSNDPGFNHQSIGVRDGKPTGRNSGRRIRQRQRRRE
jgi:NAD-dependent dihydropyrimidine dehydrogenase PreA subunit